MRKHGFLLEAIQVDGAEYIGSANGFDVFDIRTWQAATEFQIGDTQTVAGDFYVHDHDTFERNIDDHTRLYFFAEDNTNKVYGAVVKGNETSSDISFVSAHGNTSVSVSCNFILEDQTGNPKISANYPLPLHLVPGAQFYNVNNQGFLICDNELYAVLPLFNEISSINFPRDYPSIFSIRNYAFDYGKSVESVIVSPTTVRTLTEKAFYGVPNVDVYDITSQNDFPRGWSLEAFDGAGNVNFGANLSPEAIAQAERERQERAAREEQERTEREERERREADLRAREEEQRVQEAQRRLLDRIRYKIEGKEVTILGSYPGVKEIFIPDTIEGKPVTKISAFAFFAYDKLERLSIPWSVNIIERGAFFDLDSLEVKILINPDCRVTNWEELSKYLRKESKKALFDRHRETLEAYVLSRV